MFNMRNIYNILHVYIKRFQFIYDVLIINIKIKILFIKLSKYLYLRKTFRKLYNHYF